MGTLNNPDGLQDSVDPVDQLVGILASDDGVTVEPQVDEDPQDDEEVIEEDQDLQSDEEDESDLEESEDENLEEDDSEELEDDDDEEDYFTVKVNGEEKQVTQDELVKAYQLDAVITQKSQAASEKEKAIDTHLGELTKLREQQVLSLQAIKTNDQVALAEYEKINWEELKAVDPDAFMLKREERREVAERVQEVEARQMSIATEQQTQNIELFNQAKVKANEELSGPNGIPGWADEKKGPVLRQKVRAFAEGLGFTAEELKTMIDPKALKLLNMARQFAELSAAGNDLATRKAKKRNPKSVKRTAKRPVKGKVSALKDAAKKAQQSGEDRDAANFFGSMPDF